MEGVEAGQKLKVFTEGWAVLAFSVIDPDFARREKER
jgi:hypothetical protein